MKATTYDAGVPRMQKVPSASTSPPVDAQATPRAWWLLVYVACVALVIANAPMLRAEVNRQLESSGALAQVKDAGLADLAVNIGILVAILLFMVVLALYLSLASALDRRIFRPRLYIRGRGPFGLFFLVAAGCTLPVHAVSTAFSITAPKQHLLFYAYVIAVGVATPFLFRRHWADKERSGKATLFAAALMVAAASYVA